MLYHGFVKIRLPMPIGQTCKIVEMRNESPSLKRLVGRACLLSGCLLLTGCVPRAPVQPAAPSPNFGERGYVDLKAGWRLRVVVPILRSGGYIVPMTSRVEGNTVSVSTGKDFIGYETEYYAVRPRGKTGVSLHFSEAEAVEEGKASRRTQPMIQLFSLPPDVKFVRLVYLIRVSKADHDMVLLAASHESTLNRLTAEISANDSAACKSSAEAACVRVPPGIAVVPEQRRLVDGRMLWGPVD